VRELEGQKLCALCGAVLVIPDGESARIMLVGSSGKANVRTISVDGREIHRCVTDWDHLVEPYPVGGGPA
jgi:hypothetical protein